MTTFAKGKRLLIVDDDPLVRSTLLRMGQELGCATSTVSDSADFEIAYSEAHPDIILLDLNLPGVHGVELLWRLAEWKSISTVYLMSDVSIGVLRTTALLGTELGLNVSGFLPKPIDIEAMRARLTDPKSPQDPPTSDGPGGPSGTTGRAANGLATWLSGLNLTSELSQARTSPPSRRTLRSAMSSRFSISIGQAPTVWA